MRNCKNEENIIRSFVESEKEFNISNIMMIIKEYYKNVIKALKEEDLWLKREFYLFLICLKL